MKEAIIQYNDDPDADGGHMVISWKEIVRCKDCKYNDDGECVIKAGWFPVTPDWFCADGTRRDYVKPVTESATDWDGINCE